MWLRSISILFFQLLAVNSLFADANVWSEKLATDRILFSEDQESISAATISRSGREIQLRTLQNGFSSLAMEMAEEDELSHWLVAVRQVVREAKPLELPLSTGNEPDTPFPWLASGSGVLFSFSRNRKGEMSTPLGVPALSYGSGNEGSVVSGKEKAGNNSLISKCYHSMRQGYSGPGGVSQPHSTLLIRLSFRTPSYSPHSSNSSQIKDSLRSDSFIQSSYRTSAEESLAILNRAGLDAGRELTVDELLRISSRSPGRIWLQGYLDVQRTPDLAEDRWQLALGVQLIDLRDGQPIAETRVYGHDLHHVTDRVVFECTRRISDSIFDLLSP